MEIWAWVGFTVLVLAMLAIDLGILHREAHIVSLREAAVWSAVWITLSLLFKAGIYAFMGAEPALQFLTGYLIEKALSVDNIFVFVLVFSYFGVPAQYQHRVLFWGVLGALAMRAAMIFAGVALIERFGWIMYIFGAFLVFTGIRMATRTEHGIEPENNPAIRVVRRFLRVTNEYHGQKFFLRASAGGQIRTAATPLFVVLILVETTDLLFALDSIPAIFAITTDPFLAYTSNVFAILGLRSLYFLLAGIIHRFHYLKLGLAVVLVFVGLKMLIAEIYHIPIGFSLLFIAVVLGAAIAASLLFPQQAEAHDPVEHDPLGTATPPRRIPLKGDTPDVPDQPRKAS